MVLVPVLSDSTSLAVVESGDPVVYDTSLEELSLLPELVLVAPDRDEL